MKKLLFLGLFICFNASVLRVIAPSAAFANMVELQKTIQLAERKIILKGSTDEINTLIDSFFEMEKVDQKDAKTYLNKMIETHFAIADSPLGKLPSKTELGFNHIPTYLQKYYGLDETTFTVNEKIWQGKKAIITSRPLTDWEIDTRVIPIPKLQWIFSEGDKDKVQKTSPFSLARMHPLRHIILPHNGEDVADTCAFHAGKTPLFSPLKGMYRVHWKTRGGYSVEITDPIFDFSIELSHIRKAGLIKKGTTMIDAHTFLGFMGNSGESTANHVHVEMKVAGILINPTIVWDSQTGKQKAFYFYIENGKVLPVQQAKLVT